MTSSSPRHDSVSSRGHSLRDEPSEFCRWGNRLGTWSSHALLSGELWTRRARCVSGPGTRTTGGPDGGGAWRGRGGGRGGAGAGAGPSSGLGLGAARVRAAAADSPAPTGNRSEAQPEPAMEQPRKAVVVTGGVWPRKVRAGPGTPRKMEEATYLAVRKHPCLKGRHRGAEGHRACRAPGTSSGFGPFGEHTVNASWIAVQELEKLGLGDSVDLHVYEIPVEYQTVQRLIPALWEKHSPQLVVHVGVSGMATAVTLEKCGHNKGYKGLDNCRFCPGSQCCVEDGPESIDSIIDMDAVCKRVTTLGLDVSVTISQDAGRYLCDFTYYTSLYQSHGRSAFVHVPPLGKPYNADQLGRALRAIIEEMLDLLEQSEGKINCCHEH
uniref:Pyroglutamyl-peptidase I n=1 Tax=Bos indicus x Bos taurus TaxID=30522 RepID=A0A4W2DVW5_BOBOX